MSVASSDTTTGTTARKAAPQLRSGRIVSIDVFRALTVLVMIIVNQWGGVQGLPNWMKHMAADADAMSFVDVVFPAFLFIVGMSIPFALQQRQTLGDSWWQRQSHVLQRALGLVVIGVLMVNAEGGYHSASMLLPIAAWALLSYLAAFLIWGSVSAGPALSMLWRVTGMSLLLVLALLYHGGAEGQDGLTPQWWGILGLIGWAYLIACLCFQICRGRLLLLLVCVMLCIVYFVAHRNPGIAAQPVLAALFSQPGHFSHAAIVLCGCITALIFFDQAAQKNNRQRFAAAIVFALALAVIATFMRPEYKISKIYATPGWVLYCAAICVLVFCALYLWIDVRGHAVLPRLLAPVAANPLLAYLIPFILGAALQLAGLNLPQTLNYPVPGVLYALGFALALALLVKTIAKAGIRLRI
jgi:heparan-alpha-glucosaminide N-acetyltransferase